MPKKKSQDKGSGKGIFYPKFLAEFTRYVKENDIKFKEKGRGQLYKEAGKLYRQYKSDSNFESKYKSVIKKHYSSQKRSGQFLEKFAAQQFEYWLIKSLYGLWIQFKLTDPAKDKLIIKNIDGGLVDISNQSNTAALYKQLSAEVDAKELEKYSYLGFEDLVPNDKDGLDLIFSLKQSDIQLIRVKEETDFKWREDVKQKYFPDITEPKKPKEIKKLVKVKKPVEPEKALPSLELEKIKLETKSKLEAFQLELDKLEKLLKDKVITFEQYESSSEKIAKRYGFQV